MVGRRAIGTWAALAAAGCAIPGCKSAADKDYDMCVEYQAADQCRAAVAADPSSKAGMAAAQWLAGHAPPVPAAPSVMAVPAPVPISASVAAFTSKDTLLDECDDMMVTPPPGRNADPAGLDALLAPFMKSNPRLTRIYKPCQTQFVDMPVLATCSSRMTVGDAGPFATVEVGFTSRYYNLDTLTQSNQYMKDCLDIKGDWQAVDKNSAAYRDAVRARARREIEKAQKLLGQ